MPHALLIRLAYTRLEVYLARYHKIAIVIMISPTAAELQYMEDHISDNRIPEIVATNVTCMLIGLGAIILRFIARHLIRAERKTDDWLIVVAWVEESQIPWKASNG